MKSLRPELVPLAPRSLQEELARLTMEASKRLPELLEPTIQWTPLPGPQSEAYECQADELFYGGAAGGGKTDLALGLALTRHRRSLILRREATQLRGIVDRSREVVGAGGSFNSVLGVWRVGNRVLELGGCQHEHDRTKYQGRPHDLIVFDEAPEFLESQVRFICGWARTEDPKQRVRVLLTGNPPTSAEGMWVVDRYAPWLDPGHHNPAEPGELRWYAMMDGAEAEVCGPEPFEHEDELITPQSRTFIPAKVEDNPFYLASGYKAQLQSLPEPLRSQMLRGDFSAGVGDDPWQVIPSDWVRMAQARWTERGAPTSQMVAVGLDAARGGQDRTVFAPLYGANYFGELQSYPGELTPTGDAAAALCLAWVQGEPQINVDVIGIGAAVYDALRQQYLNTRGVNFAEGTSSTDASGRLRFANVRAHAYWALREALDPQAGYDVALPPGREILAELTAAQWRVSGRTVQVEPKADIIKRLGRSPDKADAMVLAWYYHAAGRKVSVW